MKFPKINFLFVTGVLVAFAAVGFKVAEDNATPQTGWYEVSRIIEQNGDALSNLEIGDAMPPPAEYDNENCAQKLNDGQTCSVYLTFDGEDKPETVAHADIAGIYNGLDALLPKPDPIK